MTIKEWAEKIHENAVNHGFWENEKSFAEIVALCHSELSEALEEDRAGKPLIYMQDGKPECKAVEMADCIIRKKKKKNKENIHAQDLRTTKENCNPSSP